MQAARRWASTVAIALAAISLAGAARAQSASTFACRKAYVDTTQLEGIDDLVAGPPAEALRAQLQQNGLERVTSVEDADLQIVLGVDHFVPKLDEVGRLEAPETISFHATVRGYGPPSEEQTPVYTLAGIGHLAPVGAKAGWKQHWPDLVRRALAEAIRQHSVDHWAGARVVVDPPSAEVSVDSGAWRPAPGGELRIRCRLPDQLLELRARASGYTDGFTVLSTSTTETPQRIVLTRIAPETKPSSASASSSSSSAGRRFDVGPTGWLIGGALLAGAAAVAIPRLRRRR